MPSPDLPVAGSLSSEPAPDGPRARRGKVDAWRAAASTAGLGARLLVLQRWPWLKTLRTLRERFREDRLGQTAGSLTFTTLISLVPLFTVMLALFSVFPYFASFKTALERLFLQNLVPDSIAKPVLAALTAFVAKSNHLGAAGLALLLATALALVLTIDRTLNRIWRVREVRPFTHRVLVYWAALTLGPLLLGLSLTLTSYALSASRGWVTGVPGFVGHLIDVIQFLLLVGGATVLFRFVPNTYVEGRHALAGGVFVAVGVELAKQVLGWYLVVVPTYGSIFGTFAVMPILMLWVYCVWVVVLLGAVIAAYAPSLTLGFVSGRGTPGWRFDLMLAVIGELRRSRDGPRHGLALMELSSALKADPLEVEPLLDLLIDWGWAGRLDEDGAQRHVLLADPAHTPAGPLIDRLLLVPSALNRPIRERTRLAELRLSDLLPG
jgi:membrane protein